jgi:hypothetical protein
MNNVRTVVAVCVVALATFTILASAGGAATRIVEPSAPFTVLYDASGNTQAVTIRASGFKPGDQVVIVQCNGVPATDVAWRPTFDCDSATATAAATADDHGDVSFPAGDVNFGLRIVKGPSPQRLFNCLAPGDPEPNNGVKSYTTCQVRVTTDVVHPSNDQAFMSFQFKGNTGGTSSSSDSNTGVIVIIVVIAAVVIVGGAMFITMRRRRAA